MVHTREDPKLTVFRLAKSASRVPAGVFVKCAFKHEPINTALKELVCRLALRSAVLRQCLKHWLALLFGPALGAHDQLRSVEM